MKRQPWPSCSKIVQRESLRKLQAIEADHLSRVQKLTDTSAPRKFKHIRQNAKREEMRKYDTKLLNQHNQTLSKSLKLIDRYVYPGIGNREG